MKVTFTQTIDASLVVTARLAADGTFTASVAGHCEYAEGELEGAMCSAQVEIPADCAAKIREAMEKAREQAMAQLGSELAKAKALSYKVAVEHREIGG
jgi:hypothetical protein